MPKTMKHIYKGFLHFLVFLVLVPVAIGGYIIGFLEMLGSGIDNVCDTVIVKKFDKLRDYIQDEIRRL